jgi:hypothetical protein
MVSLLHACRFGAAVAGSGSKLQQVNTPATTPKHDVPFLLLWRTHAGLALLSLAQAASCTVAGKNTSIFY